MKVSRGTSLVRLMPPATILTATFSLLAVAPSAPSAATIHVPADQPTIQAGLDAAAAGDVVLVAAGSYAGDGNYDLDFGGKNVELRSEDGAEVTTIQGPQDPNLHYPPIRALQFLNGETADAIVDGFTIRDFWSIDEFEVGNGGGAVWVDLGAAPTFRNCRFLSNMVTDAPGGAVSARGGTFEDCLFEGNWSDSWNGGGSAGAISITNGVLRRCDIRGNAAIAGQFGGGVTGGVSVSGATLVEDCTIVGNYAERTGGLTVGLQSLVEAEELWITGTTIADNRAWVGSSQIYCYSATNVPGQRAYFANCIIDGNEDCGPQDMTTFEELPDIAQVSFLCSRIDPTEVTGPMAVVYGPHAFADDPLFCDPYDCSGGSGDYALQPDSPCLPENSTCGTLVGSNGTVCGASEVPTPPASSAQLLLRTPYPNPATDSVSFELAESVGPEARIEVFAADGRRVRSLEIDAGTSSAHGASWDLQDGAGRRVPSGVYSVRVSVGTLEQSARITVLD
ncbi:MAG: hypothetical protein KDA27_19830 [Candidatus Eisenbacteria bacterium]|uniref:Right handed beta helix domain-containing protein n=1 Tax=Eiseniibacteriota bacterium TaxID=2212470 RepID=A0A956NFB8_UNCEI|nr:hypothetical protein [Candidatus Eisenbacteria bacterium]